VSRSLPPSLTITPAGGPVRGRIRPPGSKSITNRALVCAALARGTSTLSGALDSEDTRVMIDSLGRLGIRVDVHDEGRTLVVQGRSGRIPIADADLAVANSGTTIRFLTAMATLGHGQYRFDGSDRMRQRPIGDLLDALKQLGARCRGKLREGFPPVIVQASGLTGGEATVRGAISSQFLSGLLLAAPYAKTHVDLIIEGRLVSKPYVAMTRRIMEAFGMQIDAAADFSRFHIPAPRVYTGRAYAIEPDASAASYFWAAAAITGGEITVEGLTQDSLQGDVRFVECLAQMGCRIAYAKEGITVAGRAECGIDVEMTGVSDTVQTLAAVALFATGPTTIRGVAHIRHKETDRIADLARELRKFGASVEELPDGLRITPPATPTRSISERSGYAIEIETYNDHRMAMSLALAGLRLPGVTILNPGCTAKTYPRFFDDLRALAGTGETPLGESSQ
jgi:3-phosphoshikimate 1-carboxyvinyltransferase